MVAERALNSTCVLIQSLFIFQQQKGTELSYEIFSIWTSRSFALGFSTNCNKVQENVTKKTNIIERKHNSPRQIGQVGNSVKPGGGEVAICADSVYSTD